jgi:cytochrome c oxidase subunit 1/cytochrome c oxidase subunit I+III
VAIDVTTPPARAHFERLEKVWAEAPGLVGFLTTVNHKRIGKRYFVTAGAFFLAAGIEALLMRMQLVQANERVLGPSAYDQMMTMHGTTMIFLFVVPMLTGAFGNYFVPMMIGARDMAFPRMNALSYWIYLASGIFIYVGLFMGEAPNAGWFAYVPLSAKAFNPGHGQDFYQLGLVFLTISTTVGAANFIVTIFKLRAPGMSLNRMPLYVWAILATSFSQIFALPALTAANVLAELDRKVGTHFFDVSRGGDTILYQHLFWIFGHPDVYIIFLPAVGIVSTIVPVFSRRTMVAQNWLALATIVTAFVGFGVWVHHMFATGLPQITLVFYSAASAIIVVPSGIQIFGWAATLLTGRPQLKTPLLYVLGFVVTFVIGGLSGISFVAISFDQQVTDTYYVVAHFHYVLFGGAVFPFFAAMHYWYPKVTGRLYSERPAQVAFWLFFTGFNLLFFPMHIAGLLGMPRRVYTYPAGMGWDVYNLIETIGGFVLAAAILLVVANFVASRRLGSPAGPNPWGADTLEWTVSSPPPEFNYPVIPTVRSANPAWDLAERAEDQERLERGEFVLEEGHETPATTVMDADLDEVLRMPGESPWPLVLTLALTVVFVMLLTSHFVAAAVFVGVAALALLGWHLKEPQDF